MSDGPDKVLEELENPKNNSEGWSKAAADLSMLTPDQFREVATRFQADQKAHPDLPPITFTDSHGEQSAILPTGREPNSKSQTDDTSPRQVVHPSPVAQQIK
jgi:hypothetical protein